MDTAQSLKRRALVAVALTLGFYLLALVLSGILLYIPYAEWVYAGRLHIKLALGCVVAAGLILWSILPRWDRFTAPGPRLLPAEHPDLFRVLNEVATATGQAMPAEVYATAEMNAWVMNRGGLLGIGGRRVMSLGLPLLKILNVAEIKAVIAHEFGHFYGGDTRLGPWVYRTRQALMRTVQTLGEHGSIFQRPFLWYGRTFMKITGGISRSQEYTADRLAAKVAGAGAMQSALTALHAKGGAFDAFWRNEYVPALQSGFYPPLLQGYSTFIAHPSIADSLQQSLQEELERGETDTFDSHPSLRERIAALGAQRSPAQSDGATADSLLHAPQQIEQTLIQTLVGSGPAAALQPLRWEEAATKVWLPLWRQASDDIPDLPAVHLSDLPGLLQDHASLAKRLTGREMPQPWETEQVNLIGWLLGTATAVALNREGWHLRALPGEEVTALNGETCFRPFETLRQLVAGDLCEQDWKDLCDASGVSWVRLADA